MEYFFEISFMRFLLPHRPKYVLHARPFESKLLWHSLNQNRPTIFDIDAFGGRRGETAAREVEGCTR